MLALGPSLGLILRHRTYRNCISDVPRTRGAQNLGEVPWSRGLVRLLSFGAFLFSAAPILFALSKFYIILLLFTFHVSVSCIDPVLSMSGFSPFLATLGTFRTKTRRPRHCAVCILMANSRKIKRKEALETVIIHDRTAWSQDSTDFTV